MKLWLIEQETNNNYDTYDAAVVAAETEEAARDTYPGGGSEPNSQRKHTRYSAWTETANVRATYLGEARDKMPAGVVCGSFNAG